MEWVKIAADLIANLAWPVVALVAIALLRPHLASIIDRLQSFKAAGIEATLIQQGIDEAATSLATTQTPPVLNAPPQPPADIAASDLAIGAQMLAAWRDVELQLDRLAQVHGQGFKIDMPTVLVATLVRQGVIDKALADAINALRSVHRTLMHGRVPEVFQAVGFVASAREVSARLSQLVETGQE